MLCCGFALCRGQAFWSQSKINVFLWLAEMAGSDYSRLTVNVWNIMIENSFTLMCNCLNELCSLSLICLEMSDNKIEMSFIEVTLSHAPRSNRPITVLSVKHFLLSLFTNILL